MWLLTVRNLQWRRRRFVVAVLATALAFAMSLLMGWIDATLHHEPAHILRILGADAWVVDRQTSGRFTAARAIPASVAMEVAARPGVRRAEPVVLLHSTMRAASTKDVNVIGLPLGSPAVPRAIRGSQPTTAGQALADTTAEVRVGDRVTVAGHPLDVVGVAEHTTYYFGAPTIVVPLGDAQAVAFAGQPLANAVMTWGVPASVPSGLRLMRPRAVAADMGRIVGTTTQTIQVIDGLLALMAVGIIGSIVYLSALERTREFAVLKATGASSASLAAGLAAEAVALSLAGAFIGALVARFALVPLIPFGTETTWSSLVTLGVLALGTGAVASLAGLRHSLRTDPALAFGAA